jgi:serine/threonine-protein kinase HipA
MSKSLNVYLYSIHIGTLSQDLSGQMAFSYDSRYLASPSAKPLSQSLPLQTAPFGNIVCTAYFGGILPEASSRDAVVRILGISSKNDFALINEIGRECAGAVTLYPADEQPAHDSKEYQPLTIGQLRELVQSTIAFSLLSNEQTNAGADEIRLSLAGAQPKAAIHYQNGTFSLPLNGSPSTHIIKPAVRGFEGILQNEAFCMNLAARVGLPTANAEVLTVEGVEFLLVTRYDRTQTDEGTQRLHQEDFCQALGVISDHKYQREGGPSFSQSYEMLETASTIPVLETPILLRAFLFNFLIGNNDAHGKNFSLLYRDNRIMLAPLYDLICTSIYPGLSPKMAMKLGGEYESEKVFPYRFDHLAKDIGLPPNHVRRVLFDLIDTIERSISELSPKHPTEREVCAFINARCQTIRRQFLIEKQAQRE